MVAPPLVEPYIEEGHKLIEALRTAGFQVDAAFWSYYPEPDIWKLIFVSRLVDEQGSLKSYEAIQRVLGEDSSISILDVSVRGLRDKVAHAIWKEVRFRPGEITRRVRRTPIEDAYIDDALVYNLEAPAQ